MPPQPQYTTQHRFPTSQRPEKRERAVPGWAIIGVFLILLFHFVTAASAFLMPVSLGILLFFVFIFVFQIRIRIQILFFVIFFQIDFFFLKQKSF